MAKTLNKVQSNLANSRKMLSCHPSQQQMHSSTVCTGQAHSPAVVDK